MRTPACLLLSSLLLGCDDAPTSGDPAADAMRPVDATRGADMGAGPADATPTDASLTLQCTCSDRAEDCEACMRLISRCCNAGEETFGGRLPYLVATCEGDPNCAACCDECAARTCEQVVRAGDCPVQP